MSFGKRTTAPAAEPADSSQSRGGASAIERLTALRDEMLSIRQHAGRIAGMIRGDGALAPVTGTAELDAEAGPIPFKGFHEHFIRLERGRIRHACYCYGQPSGSGTPDTETQIHLYRLAGHILDLNYYCQRAQLDDALGVALQGNSVAQVLDAIIVRAAFFAGYFENMTSLVASGGDADLKAHRSALDRQLLMAGDLMLDPAHLTSLLPTQVWPHVGVETDFNPHEGDRFVNGVYLPASLVATVAEELQHRDDITTAVSAAA